MSVGALEEAARLMRFAVGEGVGGGWRRLTGLAAAPLHATGRAPDKLVIAPQDLRTSDPTRAGEIYAGVFAFAGKSVPVEGASPFRVEPPSPEWAEALHGFGWLRHLRAADTTLARANARALVEEWIALGGGGDPIARAPHVTARRVISWLCQSPLILDGADRAFYRRFLRSLARQTRRLGRARRLAPDGLPRLNVACALAYAGLCFAGDGRLLKSASAALAEELDRQILPDGGHVSRNPSALVEAMLDLLPLRQAYAARNAQPPQSLLNAVDRAMPMIRFFRHGDGAFAQFNGAGPTQADLVATILAYDDARGPLPEEAPHSGYVRLQGGPSAVLVDVGPPPPPGASRDAHAGALSFELSSGPEQIVVNCGVPRFGRASWGAAPRATAAHSTLVVADTSSCRFASERCAGLLGRIVVAGPRAVVARRERTAEGVRVAATHDGYARRFGLIHARTLTLAAGGDRLEGEDALRPVHAGRGPEDSRVALRFHLHPGVRASVTQDGQGAMLALPSGRGWLFAAPGFAVELEESIYFAGANGPRRTEQIVVHATVRGAPLIGWNFRRLDGDLGSERRARSTGRDDGPTLI
ncbi:putative heparinase superfamily protein [Methylopila capsulata]|uniref:Heparinase n=1 Tax=Methylopila capsulata TaxID=61654 RepID=A0A9W6ISX5_9HYPH|nr:heparinase II/III family protein [Methylopila capsulata]MBM7851929.1 putative heparinase superfamily protein [Methylopila capsulata]GLK54994.1 heparinase [Methylopila capsulata]